MVSIKKLAWTKIIASIILLVVGVLTCAFAIMNMAGSTACNPTVSLRILVGVVLILCGVILLIVGLVQDKDKFAVKDAAVSGAAIGLGVFWLLPESAKVLDRVVGICFPVVIACLGGALAIKYTVVACHKNPKSQWIPHLIISAILLAVGITFACLWENTVNFTWLVVGLCVSISAIYSIFVAAKVLNVQRKEKKAAKKAAKEAAKAQKHADEKPTEEKPVEEKPTEEKPVEEKPTEEKPTEEKPAEDKKEDK